MKKLLLIVALFGLTLAGYGQASEMLWGPEFKAKGSIEFLGEHNGSVYTYRYYKKDLFLEKYEMDNMTLEYSVPVDIDLDSKKERLTIEFSQVNEDGTIMILASRYDKANDKNTIYGKVLTAEGEVSTDWSELTSITAKSKRNTGDFNVTLSPDNSKILIAANLPYEKKEAERYKMTVFTTKMEVIWDRDFELPYEDKNVSISKFQVNNNGITYVLAQLSPSTKKEKKQKKKEKEDIFTQMLLTYNGQTEEFFEYEISLEKKTILDVTITLDTTQDIILCGFYKDNLSKKSGLSGVFFGRIKNGAKEPEVINTKEFEKNFIEQIIGEKRAKKGQEIPTSYNLNHLITTEDGGVIMLAEQYYMQQHCYTDSKGNTRCYYTYHYNSIIAVGVSPQGEITWNTLIPKEAYDQAGGFYLSYALMVQKNALHMVFLDHKQNINEFGEKVPLDDNKLLSIKKSVAVVATLTLDGQVTYSVLYNTKESKVYMRPRINAQLNDTSLVVLGLTKKKKVRLGRINF